MATEGHRRLLHACGELLRLRELHRLGRPAHPRLGKYEHAHTKAWSARVAAADAFVIVTPEYNFSCPPALVNALDYLYTEWSYKPVAFVSYGGLSGGTRAVQTAKLMVTTLKMVPLVEAVNLPFFVKQLADGVFTGTDAQAASAKGMLDELLRWTNRSRRCAADGGAQIVARGGEPSILAAARRRWRERSALARGAPAHDEQVRRRTLG